MSEGSISTHYSSLKNGKCLYPYLPTKRVWGRGQVTNTPLTIHFQIPLIFKAKMQTNNCVLPPPLVPRLDQNNLPTRPPPFPSLPPDNASTHALRGAWIWLHLSTTQTPSRLDVCLWWFLLACVQIILTHTHTHTHGCL